MPCLGVEPGASSEPGVVAGVHTALEGLVPVELAAGGAPVRTSWPLLRLDGVDQVSEELRSLGEEVLGPAPSLDGGELVPVLHAQDLLAVVQLGFEPVPLGDDVLEAGQGPRGGAHAAASVL